MTVISGFTTLAGTALFVGLVYLKFAPNRQREPKDVNGKERVEQVGTEVEEGQRTRKLGQRAKGLAQGLRFRKKTGSESKDEEKGADSNSVRQENRTDCDRRN